jgi:hypothetical protein
MNEEYISPENCPLCNKVNQCSNLSNSNKPCWCTNEGITFPVSLLNQVLELAKNKACICKSCALKHKQGL